MKSSLNNCTIPRFAFLDLGAQFTAIRDDVRQAVVDVLESQQFILGTGVESLEREVARYVGCEFAIGCASGSDALLLALMALGIAEDDEIITTPFTFVATAGSIARLKARPVFVDIDPVTYNIDPTYIKAAITSKTRAIIPVHLFGLAADMPAITSVAANSEVPLIEDAAQAIGARCGPKPVGSIGMLGCFSFFPSKNLGGAGDGGLVSTHDVGLADRLRVLRVHGSRRKYHYEMLGINSRLDAIQAAVLKVKLPHLDHWANLRRHNADRYRAMFEEFGLDRRISLPREPEGRRHVYNQFVIRAERRDELQKHLTALGIPTEVYYPSPLHLQPAFEYLSYRKGDFPEAEKASQEVLALPIYPELQEWQQRAVVEAVSSFYH